MTEKARSGDVPAARAGVDGKVCEGDGLPAGAGAPGNVRRLPPLVAIAGGGSSADAPPEAPEPRRRWTGGRRVVLGQFALCGLALLVVIGTIGAVALRHLATDEATRDARELTVALSRGVIRDHVTPDVLRGDRAALDELDRAVRDRVLGPIVRIKVWTTSGRIAYSDARPLVGRSFVLPADLREALADDAVRAEVSDLKAPENRLERNRGRLVEVYVPLQIRGGERVLVEAYHPASTIAAGAHRIWRTFLPVLVALLLALALAQLPLAWFLARKVGADERERERLARRADDALEAERRRIAAELHDGVVQDLAGVAYDLQATADYLPPGAAGGELPGTLRRSAGVCRDSMRALRTLLVELYPSDRRAQGLGPAVEELARPLRRRGVDVHVDVALDGPLPSDASELVYRAAQEALRNVDRHAAARVANVALRSDGESVTLLVEDDGRGMTGDNLVEQHAAGHMGLALLADGVAARGGAVTIESEPGSGTRLRLSLPLAQQPVAA